MKSILLFVLTFSYCFCFSQPLREGKATFKINFPDSENENRILELTGSEKVVYFKDSLTRTEQVTKMGKVITLYNYRTKLVYTLTERDDDKIALKMNANELSTIRDMSYVHLPDLKITNETKKIAGYKCTKAILSVYAYGEHKDFEVWYTKEIALPNPPEYTIKGIDGYMMEFTFYNDGKPMKITCTSVEKIKVLNEQLRVPKDYTIKTVPDLMKPSNEQGQR